MSETTHVGREGGSGFDPDEDLFAFGDRTLVTPFEAEETEDLEEIFEAFRSQEQEQGTVPAAEVPTPALRPAAASAAPAPLVASAAPAVPRAAPAAELPGAPDEPAAPTPAERERAPRRLLPAGRLLPGTALVVLASIVMLNALVAFLTLRTAASLQAKLASGAPAETAHAPAPAPAESSAPGPAREPLVAPDPEQHPVFLRAREEIEQGDYAAARRRLYALLSVIDRLEEPGRSQVEARAHYLIARALQLEAVGRLEERG